MVAPDATLGRSPRLEERLGGGGGGAEILMALSPRVISGRKERYENKLSLSHRVVWSDIGCYLC